MTATARPACDRRRSRLTTAALREVALQRPADARVGQWQWA
jgi:hypothetical protein